MEGIRRLAERSFAGLVYTVPCGYLCLLSCFARRLPGECKEDHHPVTQAQMREFKELVDEKFVEVQGALDAKKDKRRGELGFSQCVRVWILAFSRPVSLRSGTEGARRQNRGVEIICSDLRGSPVHAEVSPPLVFTCMLSSHDRRLPLLFVVH